MSDYIGFDDFCPSHRQAVVCGQLVICAIHARVPVYKRSQVDADASRIGVWACLEAVEGVMDDFAWDVAEVMEDDND